MTIGGGETDFDQAIESAQRARIELKAHEVRCIVQWSLQHPKLTRN